MTQTTTTDKTGECGVDDVERAYIRRAGWEPLYAEYSTGSVSMPLDRAQARRDGPLAMGRRLQRSPACQYREVDRCD